MDYIFLIVKLIFFSLALLLLLVVILKKTKNNIDRISSGKYVNVIERQQISKTDTIYVLKLGDEGSVIMSSTGKIQKIKDLSKEDIRNIELQKEEAKANMSIICNEGILTLKKKSQKFLSKVKR